MGLVNFTLAKAIPPKETAMALQKVSKQNQEIPINKLSMIISKVMEEVPGNVNQISSDILGEINSNYNNNKASDNVFEPKRRQRPPAQQAPTPQRSGSPFNPFSR